VLSGAGRDFQPLLEQIEADANIPAIEIAAALASLMQGSTPLLLAAKPEAEATAPPRIDGSQPTQTYRLEVGHAQGVLPGNIVGAIANEAGIEGRHIGHIDIRDDHSYVDLPTLPDETVASLQNVKVRGEAIRIRRVDSKPDKPRFSGKSMRPDRMAEAEDGPSYGKKPYAKKPYEKKPYMGGGNRFDKGGEPRPFESRRAQSRNYKGTPRFQRDDDRGPPADAPAASHDADAAQVERPRYAGKPRFGDKPGFGDKPKFGGRPRFGGKPASDGKPGGFKKKFVGKAAGAKGSYKGGKAFRDKSR
jgi:hypothetical protein